MSHNVRKLATGATRLYRFPSLGQSGEEAQSQQEQFEFGYQQGLEQGHDFDQLVSEDIVEIQQRLLANGCFLPNYRNNDAKDRARHAKISATSDAPPIKPPSTSSQENRDAALSAFTLPP